MSIVITSEEVCYLNNNGSIVKLDSLKKLHEIEIIIEKKAIFSFNEKQRKLFAVFPNCEGVLCVLDENLVMLEKYMLNHQPEKIVTLHNFIYTQCRKKILRQLVINEETATIEIVKEISELYGEKILDIDATQDNLICLTENNMLSIYDSNRICNALIYIEDRNWVEALSIYCDSDKCYVRVACPWAEESYILCFEVQHSALSQYPIKTIETGFPSRTFVVHGMQVFSIPKPKKNITYHKVSYTPLSSIRIDFLVLLLRK